MTVLITLTTLGIDTGPLFNLSSSPDGTTFTQFATGIAKLVLEGGYSATVPDGTTTIRVTSTGVCTNYEDITISGLDCGLVATAVISTPATTTSTTTAPVTNCVLNYGASMVPCIGGTVDDYMEAYIALDNPVTVETIFEILVNYISGTPSGNCSNPTSQQTIFVTVLAGENQGQVTCPQAVFINSNGATICSVELINSPYNVCV